MSKQFIGTKKTRGITACCFFSHAPLHSHRPVSDMAAKKIKLPLELVGIIKGKAGAIIAETGVEDMQLDTPRAPRQQNEVSNMVSLIDGRAKEELRCYVRSAMIRTGFA